MDGYEYPARPAASPGKTIVRTVLPSWSPPDGPLVRFPFRVAPVRWSSGSVAGQPASPSFADGGPKASCRRSTMPRGLRGARFPRTVTGRLVSTAWLGQVRFRRWWSPSFAPSTAVGSHESSGPSARCRTKTGLPRLPFHVLRVSVGRTPGRSRRRDGPCRTRRVQTGFRPVRRPAIDWRMRRGC